MYVYLKYYKSVTETKSPFTWIRLRWLLIDVASLRNRWLMTNAVFVLAYTSLAPAWRNTRPSAHSEARSQALLLQNHFSSSLSGSLRCAQQHPVRKPTLGMHQDFFTMSPTRTKESDRIRLLFGTKQCFPCRRSLCLDFIHNSSMLYALNYPMVW